MEVTVNADKIKAIRLVNLSETTKASYPLMEPVLNSLASQIYSSQSLEDIQYRRRPEIYLPGTPFGHHTRSKKSGEHISSPLFYHVR